MGRSQSFGGKLAFCKAHPSLVLKGGPSLGGSRHDVSSLSDLWRERLTDERFDARQDRRGRTR